MDRRTQLVLLSAAMVILIFVVGCFSDDDPVTPDPVVEGSIVVDPTPDILNAPWVLTGPDSYSKTSNGDQSLSGLSIGDYTLAWGDVTDYTTPANATRTLAADGTVTFSGVYVEVDATGTVIIDQTPNVLAGANWSLTGPQNETGSGDATLTELPAGQYSLIWGDVIDYITPASDPLDLVAGETITFSGAYAEAPDPIQGFVLVPPASDSLPVTFTMGSSVGNEETPHQVTMTTRINMSATEVTYSQYLSALQWAYDNGHVTATATGVLDAFDGSTEQLINLDGYGCRISFNEATEVFSTTNPDQPVGTVSWYGAVSYCDWLSLQEGLPRAYNHSTWSCNDDFAYGAFGYRLPTEAEWELACRAGTTTEFSTGDCLDSATEANFDGGTPFTGCATGPYLGYIADVGSYPVNGWGLFDMHGNAFEWCNDRYDYYGGDVMNPEGLSGNFRVLRGGYAYADGNYSRSAKRHSNIPNVDNEYYGFRVVLSLID